MKKVIKKAAKKEQKQDRREYLKQSLMEHLIERYPETERSFDMEEVVTSGGCKGTFRECLDGDFKPEDRKLFYSILQDLKNEKFLLHKSARYWARL